VHREVILMTYGIAVNLPKLKWHLATTVNGTERREEELHGGIHKKCKNMNNRLC
jgi:hypothetical protein